MGDELRLSPVMVSRKNLVLRFIVDYFATNFGSPSLSEIAAGTNTNRQRVKDCVRRLVKEGRLENVGGARGLRLPAGLVTKTTLPLVIELDHVPPGERGSQHSEGRSA